MNFLPVRKQIIPEINFIDREITEETIIAPKVG